MVLGFAGLLAITELAYRNAPPIPGRVVDPNGTIVITGDDIGNGQAVFLRYGLMDNGTIWGHGAYLGPDYSAEALHRIGDDTAAALAQQQYGKPVADLTPMQAAALRAEVAVTLKTNRYDAASDTLHLTAPEAAAYRQQVDYWARYFHDPVKNGGLSPT
jgi:nitric oxide reductase subunit B